MDKVFENARWIWNDKSFNKNEYCEFCDTFKYERGKVNIRISVCGDYTLFINGEYVSSNQYADFEYYKVYDNIDITQYLKQGENTVSVLAWYFGKSGMRYLTPSSGLIYEIFDNNGIVCESNSQTLSRKSIAYLSGSEKKISPQLGYSFTYDSTKEDEWLKGELDGFSESVVIQEKKEFYERPVKKHLIKDLCKGEVISQGSSRYLIDLGEEVVGLCSFSINSKKEQNINISYGECLDNGHVKRKIDNRDFSFDYVAKAGKNTYTNYMLRLACRYIEIECEDDLEIEYIGILPQTYPVKEKSVSMENLLDNQIYNACVNTLKLCMMEHYVDCPWREQCLYSYDSRNQILSGYYAFEDGNTDYARANLYLMSKDNRIDELLSICFPSGEDLTIPAFSLYYILAIREFIEYTGDLKLAESVFGKLKKIMKAFCDNMSDGLVCSFEGENHWNFYDWSPYASGSLHCKDDGKADFIINCVFLMGLDSFDYICKRLGAINEYASLAEGIKLKLKEKFYDGETFFISDSSEDATELANSFAVLLGIADEAQSQRICEKLARGQLVECSLSMKPFKYDALLKVNKEKYKPVILGEIRQTYKKMLDEGSTTVWETINGASDFDNAGSLCHGWSAIPVYYYHILGCC